MVLQQEVPGEEVVVLSSREAVREESTVGWTRVATLTQAAAPPTWPPVVTFWSAPEAVQKRQVVFSGYAAQMLAPSAASAEAYRL
jgi:hypothetical protein